MSVSAYSTYEAKAKFSEILRKARAGESVCVTYRGYEVAEIRPVKKDDTVEERFRRLVERGCIVPASSDRAKRERGCSACPKARGVRSRRFVQLARGRVRCDDIERGRRRRVPVVGGDPMAHPRAAVDRRVPGTARPRLRAGRRRVALGLRSVAAAPGRRAGVRLARPAPASTGEERRASLERPARTRDAPRLWPQTGAKLAPHHGSSSLR